MVNSHTPIFEFQSLGIGSVLKLNIISVPLYQREYSWNGEKVTQLYDDLASAKREDTDYFLGTIVTIPNEDDRDGGLHLVDGQQRLTTTAMLIAAIRNFIDDNELDKMVVESINNDFLSVIDRRASKRIPRLKLNVDDNDFFMGVMDYNTLKDLKDPTRDSHQLILGAMKLAATRVKDITAAYPKEEWVAALNDWLDFLERQATVILLKAPDGAQAFRMFETLNDRGLRTSQMDLVKSYLFGQSGKRIHEAQVKWASMRGVLEEIDDDSRGLVFLRHFLIATRQFTRSDNVFSTVKEHVRGETNSIAFLSELENTSKIYIGTYSSESDIWAGLSHECTSSIKNINKFDIKALRPLILSLKIKFSPTELSKAYKFLNSLSVRLLIAFSTRSGAIEELTSSAALKIYRGEITTAEDVKFVLRRITPDDQTFKEAFSLATVTKADYARYYLRALEHAKLDDPEQPHLVNEDPTIITLEHILPKNPNLADWPEFDTDNVGRFTRRIGNMCLLQKTPNSSIGNIPFKDKRITFQSSPFVLSQEVVNYSAWTPNAIETRQLELASLALKAWPV